MERGDLEPSDKDSIKLRGFVGGRVGPERPKLESLKQERSSSFVSGGRASQFHPALARQGYPLALKSPWKWLTLAYQSQSL